jgi:hypothetical protein
LFENHLLNRNEFLEDAKEAKLIEAIEPGVLESAFLKESNLF